MDTHILVDAAEAERNGESNDALRLIFKIIEDCPKLIFSEPQKEEAQPHLARVGFRFPPQTINFFRELDHKEKLVALKESKMKKLKPEAEKVLIGSMKDDRHLYSAAVKYDRIIITKDPNLLENRKAIKDVTEVTTLSLEEALAAS